MTRNKRHFILAILLTGMLMLSACSANTVSAAGESSSRPPGETAGSEQEESDDTLSEHNTNGDDESKVHEATESRVSYAHDGIELSLSLPSGWSHRICTAEECAALDGMMTFGLSFWPDEAPEMELSYGYFESYGLCGTGVTIEEITLNSGAKAWRYTEVYQGDGCMWMNVIPEVGGWTAQDDSCVLECFIPLELWAEYEDDIMEIAKTLEAIATYDLTEAKLQGGGWLS